MNSWQRGRRGGATRVKVATGHKALCWDFWLRQTQGRLLCGACQSWDPPTVPQAHLGHSTDGWLVFLGPMYPAL